MGHETKAGKEIVNESHSNKDTFFAYFWYPPRDPDQAGIKFIELGLVDGRAADNIRIHFDFKRDGYVIEQGSIATWKGDDKICDRDWQEVAFVEPYKREEERNVREGRDVDDSLRV